jgi:uncharacterized membrane protein YfcA
MFDLPTGLLLIACFTVFCASAVQTAIGFGLGLICVPILLLIEPAMVPAPILMISIVQLVFAVWFNRANVQWPLVNMALLGRLPGTLAAMGLMLYFGELGLNIFIATSVLLAVVLSLFKLSAKPTKKNHIIAGFFSGVSGTTSGIGGPPIALLYQHQPGDVVRANLSAYFFVGGIMSIIGMGMVGFVTLNSWIYAAMFIPATMLGVGAGFKLKRYLKPTIMRPAILTLCSISAIAVIVTSLSR